jgi:hypothetical protein
MNEVYDNIGRDRLETEHAEYDLVGYEYITVRSDSICVELRSILQKNLTPC